MPVIGFATDALVRGGPRNSSSRKHSIHPANRAMPNYEAMNTPVGFSAPLPHFLYRLSSLNQQSASCLPRTGRDMADALAGESVHDVSFCSSPSLQQDWFMHQLLGMCDDHGVRLTELL